MGHVSSEHRRHKRQRKGLAVGDEGINLWQHIGGAHYVSATSGYHCVDLKKWYQPYGSKDGDKIAPTWSEAFQTYYNSDVNM